MGGIVRQPRSCAPVSNQEIRRIDHTGVVVSDFEAGKRFYERALGAIGLTRVLAFPAAVTGRTDVAGFGPPGKAEFWVSAAMAGQTANKPPLHVAFLVDTGAEAGAFHRAALAAGGTDNGAPGVRAHYHLNDYGAFVRDPDGRNIEAVCHAPV